MTKTLKYKSSINNTRKLRGGVKMNIFGKSDYGTLNYMKPRVFKETKNLELPFMYFYDISDLKEKQSTKKEEQKTSEEQKSTEEEQKSSNSPDAYDKHLNNIFNSTDDVSIKKERYIELKKIITSDNNITDERRNELINKINPFTEY